MSRSSWSTRFALWVAVCALLLKAAVPMLASASAQVQGKALVEVCTVYGVATVALDDHGDQGPAPEHASHAGDHCALSALMALAAPEGLAPSMPMAPAAAAKALPAPSSAAPDASAAWAARLKHGPPAFA
jgi:hypothetical protein